MPAARHPTLGRSACRSRSSKRRRRTLATVNDRPSSFYSRWLFPRLCHLGMASGRLAEVREETLAGVAGEVLEIGFGTGLNLRHYPAAVAALTAVDVNPGMIALARRRLDGALFPVRLETVAAEALPFDAGSFDAAVSTWTLCSIAEPGRALAEVRRVLRPGGRLAFVEHGLHGDAGVARWQRRLTPIQRRIADGCHLDRDIAALVAAAGFELGRLDRFDLPSTPRVLGHLYRGDAVAR
jgi:ubiquinone/menaquinone biosynthesis C-methylase UbiE